jgi:hypothetical protein
MLPACAAVPVILTVAHSPHLDLLLQQLHQLVLCKEALLQCPGSLTQQLEHPGVGQPAHAAG